MKNTTYVGMALVVAGFILGFGTFGMIFDNAPPIPEYDASQGAWSEPRLIGEGCESLDYRATEIKAIELSIVKRIKWLNSDELANRSDAGMMIRMSLDLLLWDLERLAKYTDRDLEAVADLYGVILPLEDGQ